MNKLRKRFFYFAVAFCAIAVVALSCNKANIDFGSQWLDNDYTKVIYVDTFSANISTVYLDSFSTSGTGYGVAGVYKDPQFGTVNASCFAQFEPPTYSSSAIDTYRYATFDSLTLLLKMKGGNYGDTTKNLTLSVNQLSQNIQLFNNQTSFYNTTSFPFNTSVLGTKTFSLKIGSPLTGDTLSIRLSDALGNEFLSMLKSGSSNIQSATQFVNYFKGLRISGSGTDGFMINFSDSIAMRLYYHSPGQTINQQTYTTFDLYNSSYQFNNITVDRSGTLLGNQNFSHNNNSIPSALTDSLTYLQPITSSLVKIQFPTIRRLLQSPNYLQVSRATLTFQPQFGTNLPFYALPPSLYLYTTDYANGLGTALTYSSSVQTGSLYLDPTTGYNTYTYDLTTYIQGTELASENLNQRGLLICPPTTNFKTTFNRMVIPDLNGQTGKIQLQVYYIAAK
ncbi:DUF4270 family protein [Rhizosphaericola mali]|uniref:DUF4270 domain-containing protein n=1 Tax=Rhizosphaericola mali TaxID=2545455 RepID=A0A5P2G0Y4_9BACT|nr:DUF4270 family protein [Rhizosphaericola mali]QES87480.1 DUF4270 domain-containing protein [Rhizosphaericola mali]